MSPVRVFGQRMNFNAVQQYWFAYQTHLNQDMASKGPTVSHNSTASQYIDLDALGRQPILSQCLESYQAENGVVYPNYENSLMEKSNQEAMICLTDFRNGELIAYFFHCEYYCTLQFYSNE